MRRALVVMALGGALTLVAVPARAGDATIVQSNKAFSRTDLSIKAGDTVTFKNDDQVTHNVYSITPGLGFDLRTQPPGRSGTVPFPKAGVLDVECAIHPRMKLKLTVLP